MKQGIFEPIKTVLFLVFISMFAFQPSFTWADDVQDMDHIVYLAEDGAIRHYFSTPDDYKKFTAKYCKKGFATREGQYDGTRTLQTPPRNPNDDDGAHCYVIFAEVFQVLGDNEGLYGNLAVNGGIAGDTAYYISFGKGGRAVSVIQAIVNVKGSYKYESNAGLQIVPNLRILKIAGEK